MISLGTDGNNYNNCPRKAEWREDLKKHLHDHFLSEDHHGLFE